MERASGTAGGCQGDWVYQKPLSIYSLVLIHGCGLHPRTHSTISRAIAICHKWKVGHSWHLAGRGQDCRWEPYSTQDSHHNGKLAGSRWQQCRGGDTLLHVKADPRQQSCLSFQSHRHTPDPAMRADIRRPKAAHHGNALAKVPNLKTPDDKQKVPSAQSLVKRKC